MPWHNQRTVVWSRPAGRSQTPHLPIERPSVPGIMPSCFSLMRSLQPPPPPRLDRGTLPVAQKEIIHSTKLGRSILVTSFVDEPPKGLSPWGSWPGAGSRPPLPGRRQGPEAAAEAGAETVEPIPQPCPPPQAGGRRRTPPSPRWKRATTQVQRPNDSAPLVAEGGRPRQAPPPIFEGTSRWEIRNHSAGDQIEAHSSAGGVGPQ